MEYARYRRGLVSPTSTSMSPTGHRTLALDDLHLKGIEVDTEIESMHATSATLTSCALTSISQAIPRDASVLVAAARDAVIMSPSSPLCYSASDLGLFLLRAAAQTQCVLVLIRDLHHSKTQPMYRCTSITSTSPICTPSWRERLTTSRISPSPPRKRTPASLSRHTPRAQHLLLVRMEPGYTDIGSTSTLERAALRTHRPGAQEKEAEQKNGIHTHKIPNSKPSCTDDGIRGRIVAPRIGPYIPSSSFTSRSPFSSSARPSSHQSRQRRPAYPQRTSPSRSEDGARYGGSAPPRRRQRRSRPRLGRRRGR
ncbi:hypothetical protein B0H19DRAFT_600540 [Mycena capillaripes]|nr:hypothetical protein B0H19DRAFT_600540 [Mycena capillaripes]